MAVLLVSDLHLCPTRPGSTQLFLSFLQRVASQAEALYILGDLFEYWAGDDDLGEPFNASIAAALAALTASGTRVFVLAGNRDFLLGPEFEQASGTTILPEPQFTTIAATPALLLHGDSLCTNDKTYQAFCREVRSVDWRRAFLARPLAERHAEIEAMRVRSEEQKRSKPAAVMDVAEDAVAEMLRGHGYPPLMVHGHTHRPGQQQYVIDGHHCTRWTLGDWHHSGSYLCCNETGCRALPWPAQ